MSDYTTTSPDVVVLLGISAISSLALAAIGQIALVSNCSTTYADIEERLDISAIWPMAASARGKLVGARGEHNEDCV